MNFFLCGFNRFFKKYINLCNKKVMNKPFFLHSWYPRWRQGLKAGGTRPVSGLNICIYFKKTYYYSRLHLIWYCIDLENTFTLGLNLLNMQGVLLGAYIVWGYIVKKITLACPTSCKLLKNSTCARVFFFYKIQLL